MLKRILKSLIILGFVFCIGFYTYACFTIRQGVIDVTAKAIAQFPGDKIDALIKLADSDKNSLELRNDAVWALGQLQSEKALPILKKYYTGQECDHSQFLCQRELKKAIELADGGLSLVSWVHKIKKEKS